MGKTVCRVSWAVAIAALALLGSSELVNVEVTRLMDVASTIAISRTTVRIKNAGTDPARSFFLAVRKTEAEALTDLWVCDASESQQLRVLPIEPATHVPGLKSCCTGFSVTLNKAILPGEEASFDVRMDVANRIRPVPEVIEGYASQFMRFTGDSYFFTPYRTESMKTTITLGSSTVTSKSGLKKPFGLSGKKLTLGPYENVAPLSTNEISVRFRNDRGFLVAEEASKDFYINHLGQIEVTEKFKVVNDGARHSGEWSRVDHSSGHSSEYGGAMGDVWANLPSDATDVKYKDLIGNVTTSRLRKPSKGKRQIQLVYRYPLMGGWRNLFWITYEIMLKNYITSHGSSHQVKLPLFPSLDVDLLCKNYVVRVFLPEWAHSHSVVPHSSLKPSLKVSSERTTLTMFGRSVLHISFKMLRSKSKHTKTIAVKYKYNTKLAWITPVIVGFGITVLFVAVILSVANALGSVSDEEQIASQKSKEKSQ